jgi:hypothetical protein
VFIYSSCGRWVFPPLLWSFPPTATFTSFPASDYWAVLLLWSFPPTATFTSFPAPDYWAVLLLLLAAMFVYTSCEPLPPTRLVYLQSQEGFPSPNLQHSVRPTLFPACLYCSYFLLLSFSFFSWWRSVCPGGYAALAQACLWEYCGTTKLTWSMSSQAVWAQATGGPGALLVSPFNMKWRFSALAGGVEGSKLCLFSVIMPAKCVSPRFHYRRLAFCFLPLAAILESPPILYF